MPDEQILKRARWIFASIADRPLKHQKQQLKAAPELQRAVEAMVNDHQHSGQPLPELAEHHHQDRWISRTTARWIYGLLPRRVKAELLLIMLDDLPLPTSVTDLVGYAIIQVHG